ncbi:zinc finger BED domain-containing protein DAYSLEEPER isoform X2 [Rhizophagus irregularis DAOM 181602=DAOM 197198]|nr:zinc finger BED domain-containing protein DAYSLEEPER isoform X2 [Rhizophagus irregularis DAOM 181602=DAOM 197198]
MEENSCSVLSCLRQYNTSGKKIDNQIANTENRINKFSYQICSDDNDANSKVKLKNYGIPLQLMFKKQKFSYTDYTDELEAYLNEPSANFDMDILAFWKVHENKFTNLSQMARDFLAIPGTTNKFWTFLDAISDR